MKFDETRFGTFHLDQEPAAFRRSWFLHASGLFTVTPYPNGISLSLHPAPQSASELSLEQLQRFDLRLPDTRHASLPIGTYFLYRDNYRQVLKYRLSELQKEGLLHSSAWIFGLSADPFLHTDRTGMIATACLEIFSDFMPGLLVIQTRSPKLLASPELLSLPRDRTVISVPIESCAEASLQRYTPGLPSLKERLFLIDRLRNEGFMVHLKASPTLPYGEFYRDSWRFAELLVRYGDYISFGSLSGFLNDPRAAPVAIRQRLQIDREFKFLEPFSYRCVYYAVQSLAVQKLQLPTLFNPASEQLPLFESAKKKEPL